MQRGESPSLQGQKWSRNLQETVDKADLVRGYDIPPTVLHWTVWTLRTSDSMAVEIRQQLRYLIQPQDSRQQGRDSYLSTSASSALLKQNLSSDIQCPRHPLHRHNRTQFKKESLCATGERSRKFSQGGLLGH